MELCPLAQVRHRITLGSPLPFGIRDDQSTLLLARDHVVRDESELSALAERGAFVAVDEVRAPVAGIVTNTRDAIDAATGDAPPETLPALWRTLGDRLADVLLAMPSADAPEALAAAAARLCTLAERAPDLAIFLVVRQDHADHAHYGVTRSLHAAIACCLVASRLGWPAERRLTLVKAALTMNLGMLDLQARLSNQARLPDPGQRRKIHVHPTASAAALRASGVSDEAWLQAVERHHEKPDGSGYPTATPGTGALADALRAVDVYTAKLAGRSGRDALPASRAARDLLVVERGNPFALALVTEFGLHPPGSLVRLHNGEVAVVVRLGADGGAPRVAVLTGRRGEPMAPPVHREASGIAHGIAGPADPRGLRVQVNAEPLYAGAAL